MPYSVTLLRWLEKVSGSVCRVWKLMLLRPLPHAIEIPTLMDGVEVDKGLQRLLWRLVPYLTEDTDIHSTHQLLTQNIETMRYIGCYSRFE